MPVISGDVHALECDPPQPARYFYHADHLGSATWITDSVGNPAQFLQYLPYGEIWRNQQRMGYDERYKYTGKERDNETGYDYFGARHYTSAISGWLSPDPPTTTSGEVLSPKGHDYFLALKDTIIPYP